MLGKLLEQVSDCTAEDAVLAGLVDGDVVVDEIFESVCRGNHLSAAARLGELVGIEPDVFFQFGFQCFQTTALKQVCEIVPWLALVTKLVIMLRGLVAVFANRHRVRGVGLLSYTLSSKKEWKGN